VVGNYLFFMEPEVSLPCPEWPGNGLYPDRGEPSPHLHTPFL
jgi:hypothetical protein